MVPSLPSWITASRRLLRDEDVRGGRPTTVLHRSILDGTRVFRLELISVESRLFEPVARVHGFRRPLRISFSPPFFLPLLVRQRETQLDFFTFLPGRAVEITVRKIVLIARTGRGDRSSSFFPVILCALFFLSPLFSLSFFRRFNRLVGR